MKPINQLIMACLLVICSLGAAGTEKFQAGENKVISTPVEGNLYLAGATLTIDAAVWGDLTAAGRMITVNDSIYDDVILAGSDILINGVLGDDAKIAGNDIQIWKNVHGDLIIAGASVQINSDVIVEQDLVIFAGQAIINGTIKGEVKVTGGAITFNGTAEQALEIKADELTLNGSVYGPATFSGNEVGLGEAVELKGDVSYWTEEGALDFGSSASGAVQFDEELAIDQQDIDWRYLGAGLITFWVFYTLSVILVVVLLAVLFNKNFQKAGEQLTGTYFKNLSYGVLYFIGLLLVTIISFVIIIGIPIGLVALCVLAFSLLFANAISALVIANGINVRYEKGWDKWSVMLVALLSFLALKLVSFIPFVGWLIAFVVIGMSFGSLVLSHAKWKT